MLLILGSQGPDVGRVHQLLLEAGETIDQGELRQAFYGQETRGAVLDFQASHVDTQGHPLARDGKVGDVTMAALERPRAPVDIFRAPGWTLAGALSDPEESACWAVVGEIGVQEEPSGSNRGPRVDVFNGPDWLGAPWCANFVSWAWDRAPGGSPFGKLASALKLRDWGAARGALVGTAELARPGDIGIILRDGGRGHVGLVVSYEVAGQAFSLVEGNCGNACRGTVRPRAAFSHMLRPGRITQRPVLG